MKLSTDQPGDQTLPQLAASCIPLWCSQQTSKTMSPSVPKWGDTCSPQLVFSAPGQMQPRSLCMKIHSAFAGREASWVVIGSQGQNFGFPPDKVWVSQVEDCPCWGPNRRTPRGGLGHSHLERGAGQARL